MDISSSGFSTTSQNLPPQKCFKEEMAGFTANCEYWMDNIGRQRLLVALLQVPNRQSHPVSTQSGRNGAGGNCPWHSPPLGVELSAGKRSKRQKFSKNIAKCAKKNFFTQNISWWPILHPSFTLGRGTWGPEDLRTTSSRHTAVVACHRPLAGHEPGVRRGRARATTWVGRVPGEKARPWLDMASGGGG